MNSPARMYALVVGAVLVAAGLIGFFYSADFSTGNQVPTDSVLGLLDVNGWHNIVHLATGALGLAAAAGSLYYARTYAFGLGAIYILVAIWGFAVGGGGVIAGLVPVNTFDNLLHLAIGIVGIAAGIASTEATTATA